MSREAWKSSYLVDVFRRAVFQRPQLFSHYVRYRSKLASNLVIPSTDIVIEGFPRSGNTFGVAAFQYAQPRKLRIARHTHAPAQVLLGIKYGVPVILLKRDPYSCISSLIVRNPDVSLEVAITRYQWFYQSLLRYKEDVVVVDFNELINDYGSAISRVNDKYGKNFKPYHNNELTDAEVFKEVEQMERDDSGGGVRETHVSRPSNIRQGLSNTLKQEMRSGALGEKLLECNELYLKL